LRLASIEEARGEVINIGNDEEMKIIDLANLVRRLLSSKSEISFHPLPWDDPRRRCSDISMAKGLSNKSEQ
jgi:nucleoside-diphosphate-sugar epimerase